MEAPALLLLVVLPQARELLALLATVGRSLQRAESVDVQACDPVDRVVQGRQIDRLEEEPIVHREVARAVLNLPDRDPEVTGDLRGLALGGGRARLLLLVRVEPFQLFRLLGVRVDPLLVHPLDLLQDHCGDPLVQAVRDPVDAPEGGEVVVRDVVVEVRQDAGDRAVDLEVVAAEEVLLLRLQRQQVRIGVERALEVLHLLAAPPPVLLRFGSLICCTVRRDTVLHPLNLNNTVHARIIDHKLRGLIRLVRLLSRDTKLCPDFRHQRHGVLHPFFVMVVGLALVSSATP